MPTEMSILANGKMTNSMVMEFTTTMMEVSMRASGNMVYTTAKGLNHTQMGHGTRASTLKERCMDAVNSFGPMVASMLVTTFKTTWKEMVSITGAMAESIKVNGKIIAWKATVFSFGPKAISIMATMSKTKKRDKVACIGVMADAIKVTGKTAKWMELAITFLLVANLN